MTSVALAFFRKAVGAAGRIPSTLRATAFLWGSRRGRKVALKGGRLLVMGPANITVGDYSWFRQGPVPTELACAPEGEIIIGSRCGFNYGVSLRARHAIHIGDRCSFGALVIVRDHDGVRGAPVVIGDRVWLSHAAVIEPGVTIGDDAVVSAGSVVVADVPPRMMAVGNPARCVPLTSLRKTNGAKTA